MLDWVRPRTQYGPARECFSRQHWQHLPDCAGMQPASPDAEGATFAALQTGAKWQGHRKKVGELLKFPFRLRTAGHT